MLSRLAIVMLLSVPIVLPAAVTHAFTEPVLTDEIKQKIRNTLEEQGYTVGKIKVEDGLFEAYAKKDARKFEIYLNTQMEIVRATQD